MAADPDPDNPAEVAELESAAKAVADECGRQDADLIPFMSTDDVARDMEAIRVALGDEPLNFIGFSYGSLIGQRYLDLFPTNIRTMVLDGVVDSALGLTGLLQATDRGHDRCCRARLSELRVPAVPDR